MARASTVAVVVPSPATSLVLVAISLASCAPMFSYGSSSSTSRPLAPAPWGRGGVGAVAGAVGGVGGDLLGELRAHVLVRVLELDLTRDGDAVVGDGGAAVG